MSALVFRSSALLAVVLAANALAAANPREGDARPGTTIAYAIEPLADTARTLKARFTARQIAVLEKLNRADRAHLRRLKLLIVPLEWHDDDLQYSPFPLRYPAAAEFPKFLVVDQPAQAFAAFEHGRLVRWGPVSTGRRTDATPSGLFHLSWRSRGRHSTVDPDWYMEWYFNFDSARGLALHSHPLPGYPASHACVRLLERAAIWIYGWGDGSTRGARGRMASRGTPLVIAGHYAFGTPPPWRSLEHLARGIDLPALRTPDEVE